MVTQAEISRSGATIWNPETAKKENFHLSLNDYVRNTALTGIAGLWYVKQKYLALGGLKPSDEQIKAIKDGMDRYTNGVMENLFHKSKTRSNIKAGEGGKDGMPEMSGLYGSIFGPKVDGIVDPIDGTTLLANLLSGAISFAAFSDMIADIQKVKYGVFLTVPPEAAQAAELSLTVEGHKKVLLNICDSLNIQPKGLTQTMLKPGKPGREINNIFLQAALELGVTPDLIDAGDVIPSLHASLSRKQMEDYCNSRNLDPKIFGKPRIVVGRTAFVEKYGASQGSIMTGGKSVGHKCLDDNKTVDAREKLTHEDFAPGDRNKTAVVATIVTACEPFGLPGIVTNEDGTFTATSLVITARDGARAEEHTYGPREFALA